MNSFHWESHDAISLIRDVIHRKSGMFEIERDVALLSPLLFPHLPVCESMLMPLPDKDMRQEEKKYDSFQLDDDDEISSLPREHLHLCFQGYKRAGMIRCDNA